MKTNAHYSAAYLQRRRFYTVLPLLVCPLLVLFFWLLGGGAAVAADLPAAASSAGLNLTLPAARLKDDSRLTKMDYYRKADQDSAKRHSLVKNDPYYRLPGLSGGTDSAASVPSLVTISKAGRSTGHAVYSLPKVHDSDRNEAMVYRKLAVLNAALVQKAPKTPPAALPITSAPPPSSDISRLERVVQSLHTRDTTTDPDLKALSGMLDKIMTLQRPSGAPVAMPDAPVPGESPLTSLSHTTILLPRADTVRAEPVVAADTLVAITMDQNGFYEAEEAPVAPSANDAIPAVIDETITVLNNSTVPFRLLNDIRVKDALIPTGSLAYGTVQLSGDRVTIAIKSVQYQQHIFTVSLTVYSPDGLPGIPAPPSVTRDVAKQSADAGIQSMGMTTFDQSLGAQATAAGIQAAKNLFSKKVRLVSVTLPAGYQVLLKDNTQY